MPPPVDRPGNAKVIVALETTEVKGTLADGVQYTFWTFGGTVPGPFVRVRVGDIVQIRLKNAAKSMHPAFDRPARGDGPGRRRGGHAARTGPGRRVRVQGAEPRALRLSLRDARACREHIANGMYGLILVEPEKGLPPVDREYYVMQGEFYTQGQDAGAGLQAIDRGQADRRAARVRGVQRPMGALLDEGAVKAKVGETVRLFVGNGGPNLISSFHVIGEIFDTVYTEGAVGGGPRAGTCRPR